MFTTESFINSFIHSFQLAIITAIVGAVFGGLLAWAVVRGDPNGTLRQLVIAACGVLAQFGGVMLAFAFLATFGFNGLVTMFFTNNLGIDLKSNATWLYSMAGLTAVYTLFQIPLMVIVFLPSLDGLRQEWYDASASLGGGAWSFWRNVGGQALISQGCVLVTQQIACQIQSEVVIGQENVGKALALGMIVVVSGIMGIYALIQRRASRWVK